MYKFYKKNSEKINISLIICLICALLISLFYGIAHYNAQKAYTHNVVLEAYLIDYDAVWESFDEKDVVITDEKVDISATQYLSDDFFEELQNVNQFDGDAKPQVEYDLHYDKESNVFSLVTTLTDKYGNSSEEVSYGAPFYRDDGTIDVVFAEEDETIFLSELQGKDINNCGLFSRLKKALKKALPIIAVVAVVVVAVVVVVAAAPAAVAAGSAAMATAGATVTAGGTIAMGTSAGALAAGISAGVSAGAAAAAGALGTAVAAAAVVSAAATAGVIIGEAQEEILSGLKSLATLLVLTQSVVLAKYEELKDKTDKYLLLGNVGSSFDLSTQFEPASYQEAVAWIQSGGSIYTPFSLDAAAAITGAGYVPSSSKGIFQTAEFHTLRNGTFGLYHYHAFANGVKVPGVHGFFSI